MVDRWTGWALSVPNGLSLWTVRTPSNVLNQQRRAQSPELDIAEL